MRLDEEQLVEALPGYDIGAELGRGGWGVVLGARHRRLGREVAIKQLPRAFAADPAVLSRFVAEARLLASLDHPHIVPIYDYVEQDGLCLLVMEKLPGGTVWSRFTTSGLTPGTACALVLAACSGLQAAHQHQILHRDIKPENLMFSGEGALKVTDFGIAKVVGGQETMATRAGEVVGTPAYMAPEQAQGGDLSPATDIYAIATMLYELLSGELPYEDDGDALALLFKHAFEKPTPLREKAPGIPEAVANVVMRGLATAPTDRYATAEAFALALAEACTAAWGPGWLNAESVPLMGSNALMAMTTASAPLVGEPTVSARPDAGEQQTMVRPGRVPTSEELVPSPPTSIAVPVRRTITVRARGVGIVDVDAQQLVPVQQVIPPPPAGVLPGFAALALALLAVVVSFIGLGSPSTGGNLGRGMVTVGGVDPAAATTVHLDLAQPVPVTLSRQAPKTVTEVELSFVVAGHRVLQREAAVTPGSGVRTVDIDAGVARYLLPGHMTARVDLLGQGNELAFRTFGVKLSQPVYLTAPGLATLALLGVLIAYTESFLHSLRRGRRVVAPLIGLIVMGLLLGVVSVLAAWLLGGRQPTVAATAVSVVIGVAAGLVLSIAGIRLGRRRRFRFTRQA